MSLRKSPTNWLCADIKLFYIAYLITTDLQTPLISCLVGVRIIELHALLCNPGGVCGQFRKDPRTILGMQPNRCVPDILAKVVSF